MTAKPKADVRVVWTDFIIDAALTFWRGWMLMLLFGVFHASADWVPAFGYWQSFFAVFVLESIVAGGVFQVSQRVRSLTPMYGKKSTPDLKAITDALLQYGKQKQAKMN